MKGSQTTNPLLIDIHVHTHFERHPKAAKAR